jgi:hypothetical protein
VLHCQLIFIDGGVDKDQSVLWLFVCADLRVSFSAARAEAWQAGQAHLMAARALEVAGQKEAELQEQLTAALTDLTNMRAWADATFTSVAGQAS